MVACNELLEFAKDFYLLQDSDLRTARDIISANKKNKNVPIDKQKVIFVPEHFYTKIPNWKTTGGYHKVTTYFSRKN